jgi:hypothetical protein
MRSGRQCAACQGSCRLRGILAHDVHADRSGQHAARMKEQVHVCATLYMCVGAAGLNTGARVLLTDSQAQCASQDAPADGEMPRLAAPRKQLERRQQRCAAVLLAVVWREARKQQSRSREVSRVEREQRYALRAQRTARDMDQRAHVLQRVEGR